MNPDETHGRFLPSRVFSRWKWIVRFGLLIVPFILFLSGSVQLYFSPTRYDSGTVFEIVNGPGLRETQELLLSDKVIARVVEKLELPRRLGTDRDNCITGIRENLKTAILRETNMIRLDVTMGNKVDARDAAEEIPRAVISYVSDTLRARSNEKIIEIKRFESDEIDRAKELSARWIKLQDVHGENPAEPGAVIALERARSAALRSEAEVANFGSLIQAEQTTLIGEMPRLVVHTPARINNTPASPKTGEELGNLILTCLAWALGAALLLPYLLELVFPPTSPRQPLPDPIVEL